MVCLTNTRQIWSAEKMLKKKPPEKYKLPLNSEGSKINIGDLNYKNTIFEGKLSGTPERKPPGRGWIYLIFILGGCMFCTLVVAFLFLIPSLSAVSRSDPVVTNTQSGSTSSETNVPPAQEPTRQPAAPVVESATPAAADANYELLPGSYNCPDLSAVELRVGMNAIVVFDKVNLRSTPVVPQVWDANIITTVVKGDKVRIIGGPECAHDGTWWEINIYSGDYVGWIREFLDSKRLLKQIK